MTEEEAAERLCGLLNEIEEAGIAVVIQTGSVRHLSIGEGGIFIAEPPCEEEPWEVIVP